MAIGDRGMSLRRAEVTSIRYNEIARGPDGNPMLRREGASSMGSLIDELQAEALDGTVPINDLLLKTKVVAEKLDIHELKEWVDRELNGYGQNDQLPEYRKIHGDLQAFNPYHGWQPIIFSQPEKVGWLFERRFVNTPAGQLDGAHAEDVEFRSTSSLV